MQEQENKDYESVGFTKQQYLTISALVHAAIDGVNLKLMKIESDQGRMFKDLYTLIQNVEILQEEMANLD